MIRDFLHYVPLARLSQRPKIMTDNYSEPNGGVSPYLLRKTFRFSVRYVPDS